MKATVKGRYEVDKSSASATFAINAGDLKLKASMTDATIVQGPSLNGLALSLEKPGSFMIDYNVPKKAICRIPQSLFSSQSLTFRVRVCDFMCNLLSLCVCLSSGC